MGNLKRTIKNILPPVLIKILQRKDEYNFRGEYRSWEEAVKSSSGYGSESIRNKLVEALEQIKNDPTLWERDTVIFPKPQLQYGLILHLLTSILKDKELSIIDFGGSIASLYRQFKYVTNNCLQVDWRIIEQEYVVELGKKYFKENPDLKFFNEINKGIEVNKKSILIVSGSLQYLRDPFTFIESVMGNNKVKYILLDRIPFLEDLSRNIITVQHVHPSIYSASYPAWLISKDILFLQIKKKFKLIDEFDSLDRISHKQFNIKYGGAFFERSDR